MKKRKVAEVIDTFSYQFIFLFWLLCILLFALVYFELSYIPNQGPDGISGNEIERMLASLYFSVITATNTGYGDIVPVGGSRFFAALQAFAGLFLVAVFISKLLSTRQTEMITSLRELTISNRLRGIREDLFLARSDFDSITAEVQVHGVLHDREHRILVLAIKQCALQFEDLNELLSRERALEGTLARRDAVIIEATHRTLARLNLVLDRMKEVGIAITVLPDVGKEVEHVYTAGTALIHRWKKFGHREAREMLAEIEISLAKLL